MRVAQEYRAPDELHFTEGEPDLEPPEELAVSEIDADAMLEEELDNEDVLEQDVDEDTLEVTLEDLVHSHDLDREPGLDLVADSPASNGHGAGQARGPAVTEADESAWPADDDDDATVDADVELGLDIVLLGRLALLDGADGADEGEVTAPGEHRRSVGVEAGDGDGDALEVAPRRSGEFVCRGCFLVRTRLLLADPVASLCRDCAT
ncbi:MAG: DUF4193 family protein [Acidimicrobiales bacterium]